MEERNLITFKCEIPDDSEWRGRDLIVPGGRKIADGLVSALRERGCRCTNVVQHSFYGWWFDVSDRGAVLRCVLCAAEGEWLLQFERKMSFVRWLVGVGGHEHYTALKQTIHSVLVADERISDVRWHQRNDYYDIKSDFGSDAT